MSSPYSLYSGGPCQRCGTPLVPGKAYCEKCGYSSPIQATGPESGSFPGQASGSHATPSGGRAGKTLKDWSTPAPATPQNTTSPAPPFTQTVGPASGSYNLPSPFQQQQPSAANMFNSGFIPTPYVTGHPPIPPDNFQNTPPPQRTFQNTSGALYGAGNYQLTGPRQPYPNHPTPANKGGISARQIIGVFLLLAILLAGGLWEYKYITARDEPTTGASQTTKATATPNTPAIFSDAFMDNANAWNMQSVKGQFAVSIANSNLSLESDNNKLLWELLPGTQSYDNFRLVFDAKLAKGGKNDGYGIYFRAKSNATSDMAMYYRFEIYGDGSYAVFKGAVDGVGNTSSMKMVDYTVDPAIQKQGGVNHIVIVAKGSQLSFNVNNQALKLVSDASYTSGTIALFVSNLPGSPPGAQALFSKFAIYEA